MITTKTDEIRVLVVDDDAGLREFAAMQLERADDRFDVMTAPGATEGLARLTAEPVDCIVSDY